MTIISNIAIVLVAVLHIYFLILEMFLWTKPYGRKTFNLTLEFAQASKTLAANQGLYNGFLAAGLLWGLFSAQGGFEFKIFFLMCVIVAGIYGGLTSSRKILWVQALPGLVALGLVIFSRM
jgi:putative membrane protein